MDRSRQQQCRRARWRQLGAVGLLVAAGPVPAAAAESDAPPVPRGDLHLKVSTGYGLTEDSDLQVSQPGDGTSVSVGDVEWDDNSLSGPSARYTDVRLGYFLGSRPWLGVAVDFLHFKVFADVDRPQSLSGTVDGVPIPPGTVAPMSTVVERYQVANGVNFLTASFVARHRARRGPKYPHGAIQPYAGAGLGPTILYTQSTVNGQRKGGPYELGELGTVLFGGTQFHVSRRFDLFVELKRTWTVVNGEIDDGESRARLRSNHFTAGAGFHF